MQGATGNVPADVNCSYNGLINGLIFYSKIFNNYFCGLSYYYYKFYEILISYTEVVRTEMPFFKSLDRKV